jgi:putative transposase
LYFHIWFGTKRRKWLLQGDVRDAAVELLKETATEKGIKLLEVEAVVDHVHLLLDLRDKGELPNAMMNLMGVSARRLFETFPELKLDAHANSFWQEGYGSKLVAPAAVPTVRRYIRTQWDRLEAYESDPMRRVSARRTVPQLREGKHGRSSAPGSARRTAACPVVWFHGSMVHDER